MPDNNFRSVINRKSYERSSDHHSVIIEDENGIILDGVLKNNFAFSSSAQWEQLFSGDFFSGIQKYSSALAGSRVTGAGVWTTKQFQGGGYAMLNLECRIVEWEEKYSGQSEVMNTAIRLVSKTVATLAGDKQTKLDSLGKLGNFIDNVLPNDPSYDASQGSSTNKERIFKKAANFLGDRIFTDASLQTKLLDSLGSTNPKPVKVKIGSAPYFQMDDMIVEGVDCEFSKELTRNKGPLFCDFRVRLSSRTAMNLGNSKNSVKTGIGLKRVFINESET